MRIVETKIWEFISISFDWTNVNIEIKKRLERLLQDYRIKF